MRLLVRYLACAAWLAAGAAAADAPTVTEAWIRATPPGARTGAAYLTLTSSGSADRLLGATTPAARTVEIHAHTVEGGLSRMTPLAALAIPAAATVRLEPGGLHLMLIDIEAPLAAGMKVSLTLQFAMAGLVEVEAPVVDARASAHAH